MEAVLAKGKGEAQRNAQPFPVPVGMAYNQTSVIPRNLMLSLSSTGTRHEHTYMGSIHIYRQTQIPTHKINLKKKTKIGAGEQNLVPSNLGQGSVLCTV